MSTIDELVSEYKRQYSLYEQFAKQIGNLCEILLKKEQIKFHKIEKRAKTIESLQRKIERPEKNYQSLTQITDLCGVRIIVYYEEHISQIVKLINQEFMVIESINKVTGLKEHEFGYLSNHLIIILSKTRQNLPEWEEYDGLFAEIQIRTVLQHAWAAVSHSLEYKNPQDAPSQFKRELYILSAILEDADKKFSWLYEEHQKLVTKTQKDLSGNILDLEINLVTLKEYLKNSDIVKTIVADAKKSDFTILEESKQDTLSLVLSVCNRTNVDKINQLDEVLNASSPQIFEYLKDLKTEIGVTWRVDTALLVQLLLLMKFRKQFTVDTLVEQKWDRNIAKIILDIAERHSKQL